MKVVQWCAMIFADCGPAEPRAGDHHVSWLNVSDLELASRVADQVPSITAAADLVITGLFSHMTESTKSLNSKEFVRIHYGDSYLCDNTKGNTMSYITKAKNIRLQQQANTPENMKNLEN